MHDVWCDRTITSARRMLHKTLVTFKELDRYRGGHWTGTSLVIQQHWEEERGSLGSRHLNFKRLKHAVPNNSAGIAPVPPLWTSKAGSDILKQHILQTQAVIAGIQTTSANEEAKTAFTLQDLQHRCNDFTYLWFLSTKWTNQVREVNTSVPWEPNNRLPTHS